jgi:hypothetical protein
LYTYVYNNPVNYVDPSGHVGAKLCDVCGTQVSSESGGGGLGLFLAIGEGIADALSAVGSAIHAGMATLATSASSCVAASQGAPIMCTDTMMRSASNSSGTGTSSGSGSNSTSKLPYEIQNGSSKSQLEAQLEKGEWEKSAYG